MSANEAWVSLLTKVSLDGRRVSPRNTGSREIICNTSITDMSNPIVSVIERKMGYRFMVAEAWWILSGRNDVSSISKYSSKISRFSDDGIRFSGAYGPKVVDQLRYVVEKLEEDPHSRQAVIDIWRPNPRESKDVPCTLTIQWFVRDNELHCVDSMRSSDCWLGWVYDVFNFSCLSMYILLMLRDRALIPGSGSLGLGCLNLVAGSQHIYDTDREKVSAVLNNDKSICCGSLRPDLFDSSEEFLRHLELIKDGMFQDDRDLLLSLTSENWGKAARP